MSHLLTAGVPQPGPTAIDTGRADLAAFVAAQPSNFYLADPLLGRVIGRVAPPHDRDALQATLQAFGGVAATELDLAAQVNNRPWNLPRLERYDGIGNRTEQIENHPTYHDAGRAIYESGMIAELGQPGGFVRGLSLFHLSSHCGEAGHNCPVACTAGIVKTLQAVGTDALRERFLPGLLSRSYATRLDGAQFLTEVQGGSDVGANATRAVPCDDGRWAIHGEKWFCSNANADLILMTARFDDARQGTPGLGLFLVPRNLDDGSANAFVVRRLKDKLGTRSMPSGEIDFNGALAWSLGPVTEGFKNMMRFVINTSRLYNAFATNGAARRAWHVARAYAAHRRAFGRPIGQFLTTGRLVADINAESAAAMVATFDLAERFDRAEQGQLSASEDAFMRVFVNANKLRTARSATECVLWGIEVLGGNGAIESFSVLPRLLRDMIVCENWEGTHNTLTAQALRDFRRLGVHTGFFENLAERITVLDRPAGTVAAAVARAVPGMAARLEALLGLDDDRASLGLRPLLEEMAWLAWATAMAEQIAAEGGESRSPTTLLARYWWNRRLGSGWGSLDVDEVDAIRALSA